MINKNLASLLGICLTFQCAPAYAVIGNAQLPVVRSASGLIVQSVPIVAVDQNGNAVNSTTTVTTSVTASSGNVANASAVATLAGTSGKTTYISGFQCTASGSTTASVANLTVVGGISGTMTYTFGFPVGATAQAPIINVSFNPPVPASAQNTAIVVTLPAGGTGNTNAACNAQGYQL